MRLATNPQLPPTPASRLRMGAARWKNNPTPKPTPQPSAEKTATSSTVLLRMLSIFLCRSSRFSSFVKSNLSAIVNLILYNHTNPINLLMQAPSPSFAFLYLSTQINKSFHLIIMRREELDILNDIAKIEKNQAILLEKTKTSQQEFLQSFAQRYLVGKKMIHKNIDASLQFLEGSFAHATLNDAYLGFSLENRIDLAPEDFNVLKMLINWTEYFPSLRALNSLQLTEIVFQGGDISSFDSVEELISYINFIAPDILKLVRKRDNLEDSQGSARDSTEKYNFDKIGADELLSFLNIALPKVLFNILLSNQMLPPELKKDHQSFECLYKNRSLEFFVRTKTNYCNLIRIFLRGLINMQLKSAQQKALMEIVFRYFFAYHHDKKQMAPDLVIQAYNKLDESTRFALADEFILFFRIIRKIGKEKFADFLTEKSAWIREITVKVNEKSLIGYQKDSVKPFNPLEISNTFVVDSGKKTLRTFEILEDYSLFYFRVDVVALDVTIRLYFLGEIDSEKPIENLLIQRQKKSGEFKSSIMAAKRGIYVFQFDNSYSWINSKTIRYENVILSPLQIKTVDQSKWISSYFQNIPTNQATADKITNIQRQVVEKKVEKEFVGVGNITKNGPFFNLKLTKPNHVYEFESENQDRFVKRFNELVESLPNIKWTLNGQPLEDNEDIHDILSQGEPKKNSKPAVPEKEREREPKKEKIQVSYEDENDDQSANKSQGK